MHGRHEVVKYCIEKMPFIEKYYAYSTDEDEIFLNNSKVDGFSKVVNYPLSIKWNHAIKMLKQIDFDAVVIMGSDDYMTLKTYQFIAEHIQRYDMIGFKDIYFMDKGKEYYWEGYTNFRKDEPIGAGRVYTKKFLEQINYNLYTTIANKGLDRIAWNRMKHLTNPMIVKLKDYDLKIVDVKSEGSMNSLQKLSRSLNLIPTGDANTKA